MSGNDLSLLFAYDSLQGLADVILALAVPGRLPDTESCDRFPVGASPLPRLAGIRAWQRRHGAN